MAGKKKDLNYWKERGKTFGIDIEAIQTELVETISSQVIDRVKAEIPLPGEPSVPIDIEKIAIKVAQILAPRIPNTEQLQQQMLEGLKAINTKISSNIDEFQSKTAEELKVIRDTIPSIIEQRQQDFRGEIAGYIRELGENGKAVGTKLGRANPLSFLDSIPPETKATLLEKIVDKLMGTQNEASIASQLLQARLEGIFTGEKLAKGEATIRDAIGRIMPNADKK